MKVTYIHHSSFLVETDENYFLFDYFEGELPEFKEDKPLLVFFQPSAWRSFFTGDL